MIKFEQAMYMAEAEGLTKTREGKINLIIKKIKAYPSDEISKEKFNSICVNTGLDPDSLTHRELNRIIAGVKHR